MALRMAAAGAAIELPDDVQMSGRRGSGAACCRTQRTGCSTSSSTSTAHVSEGIGDEHGGQVHSYNGCGTHCQVFNPEPAQLCSGGV